VLVSFDDQLGTLSANERRDISAEKFDGAAHRFGLQRSGAHLEG